MNKLKDIAENITQVSVGTWIRLALVVLALVNVTLRLAGVQTLPFAPEDISDLISSLFAIIVVLNAYWKNNSFTAAALAADDVMTRLREEEDYE